MYSYYLLELNSSHKSGERDRCPSSPNDPTQGRSQHGARGNSPPPRISLLPLSRWALRSRPQDYYYASLTHQSHYANHQFEQQQIYFFKLVWYVKQQIYFIVKSTYVLAVEQLAKGRHVPLCLLKALSKGMHQGHSLRGIANGLTLQMYFTDINTSMKADF